MRVSKVFAVVVALVLLVGCAPKDITYELMAFTNRAAISGQFFLASGSFGEEDYFLAYIREPNGSIRLQRVNARYARIYEFDNPVSQPTATRIDKSWAMYYYWRFDIPAGSIRPVFNLQRDWTE